MTERTETPCDVDPMGTRAQRWEAIESAARAAHTALTLRQTMTDRVERAYQLEIAERELAEIFFNDSMGDSK